ncbi:hypothetical protein [Streptomyces formicae]|uniref:hypothetical protein n=1 Tax=Streptomyces formicae TaxID=1616117 RepID=UPI001F59EB9D|nr:hypothetical protein [Streptomyces formicae]
MTAHASSAASPSTETVDLEATADHVLLALLPDADGHDDVTLLLPQLPAAPLATATTDLPATPESVPAGRDFLARAEHLGLCGHHG